MESLEVVLEKASRTYTPAGKEEMAGRKNGYYIEFLQQITPTDILPGIKAFIDALKATGIKIAVASSSRNASIILERIGMTDVFEAVTDGNDITHSKPDPEVFLKAAEKLGIEPKNCLVVEDADAGVDAALAAGMKCLAINSAAKNPAAHFHASRLDQVNLCDIGI